MARVLRQLRQEVQHPNDEAVTMSNGVVVDSSGGASKPSHAILSSVHTLGALSGIADAVIKTDPTGASLEGVQAAQTALASSIAWRDSSGRLKVADGTAADECATVGQLASAGLDPYFVATIIRANQCRTAAQGAGIRSFQFLRLNDALAGGETVYIKTNGTTYTAKEGVQFAKGATRGTAIAALAAYWNGLGIGANFTFDNTYRLYAIDPDFSTVEIIAANLLGDAKIWGDAAFASKGMILDSSLGAKVYESVYAAMIAVPDSEPAASNFGFQRTAADLRFGETHYKRREGSVAGWNDASNAGQWS